MINITTIDRAVQLKKKMDAAYLVFKKQPTIEASAQWTSATRAYNDYCVNVVDSLVEDRINETTYHEDILTNFERYRKCSCCDAPLLFPVKTSVGEGDIEVVEDFVASSDFVDGFPGYCYPCLVEYCTTHECATCEVNSIPATCIFKEVKNLQLQEEA